MGFGNASETAKVVDIDQGRIQFVDDKGTEHTYYRARSLWLDLSDLTEKIVAQGADDEHSEPWMDTLLTGAALIQRDDGIRVIGLPRSQTTKLTFSIRGRPWSAPMDAPKEEGLLANLRLSKPCGVATIGFMAAVWEIGNEDQWYVECYTNNAIMEALLQATRRGVARASVCVQHLRDLYTTEHDMAPVSSAGQLLLRPRRSDDDVAMPESAFGELTTIVFDLGKHEVAAVARAEGDGSDDQGEVDGSAPATISIPVVDAVTRVQVALERLRGTLRWIAAGVILSALALLGRG